MVEFYFGKILLVLIIKYDQYNFYPYQVSTSSPNENE